MISALLLLVLACGTEDWAQKTLTDGFEPELGTAHAVPMADGSIGVEVGVVRASVAGLRALPPHQLERRLVDKAVVYVLAWKLEADGDLHVVISDTPAGPTMISELPADECTKGSPYAAQMSKARADFIAIFGKPGAVGKMKHLAKPVRVRMSGVIYFDHLHGQAGVAPNGVELHPVLSVSAAP